MPVKQERDESGEDKEKVVGGWGCGGVVGEAGGGGGFEGEEKRIIILCN